MLKDPFNENSVHYLYHELLLMMNLDIKTKKKAAGRGLRSASPIG